MLNKYKKQSWLAAVLAASLLGIFFYKNKLKSNNKAVIKQEEQAEIRAERKLEEASENGIIEIPEEGKNEKEIIKFISSNIQSLFSTKPVPEESLHVNRFWFAKNAAGLDKTLVYAEYEDGHIMKKVLVEVDAAQIPFSASIKALFKAGEADWNIIQGEDLAFGKPLLLYEKDEKTGEWSKK